MSRVGNSFAPCAIIPHVLANTLMMRRLTSEHSIAIAVMPSALLLMLHQRLHATGPKAEGQCVWAGAPSTISSTCRTSSISTSSTTPVYFAYKAECQSHITSCATSSATVWIVLVSRLQACHTTVRTTTTTNQASRDAWGGVGVSTPRAGHITNAASTSQAIRTGLHIFGGAASWGNSRKHTHLQVQTPCSILHYIATPPRSSQRLSPRNARIWPQGIGTAMALRVATSNNNNPVQVEYIATQDDADGGACEVRVNDAINLNTAVASHFSQLTQEQTDVEPARLSIGDRERALDRLVNDWWLLRDDAGMLSIGVRGPCMAQCAEEAALVRASCGCVERSLACHPLLPSCLANP